MMLCIICYYYLLEKNINKDVVNPTIFINIIITISTTIIAIITICLRFSTKHVRIKVEKVGCTGRLTLSII